MHPLLTPFLMLALPIATMPAGSLTTVDHVDLQRYSGKWYEIARLPNRFENKCDRDAMAEYTPRPGGGLVVRNTCVKHDGSRNAVRGKAKVVDKQTNAKLKVTFFWPFYGDYWVIGLDPDYRWAIVGEPKRKYLWILSRTPSLPQETLDAIRERIRGSGYDPAALMYTRQTAAGAADAP